MQMQIHQETHAKYNTVVKSSSEPVMASVVVAVHDCDTYYDNHNCDRYVDTGICLGLMLQKRVRQQQQPRTKRVGSG